MSVNEETYHTINSYLSGDLQGRALDKFKIDLKNDATLQEAIATQRSIVKAIETAREKELKSFITSEVSKNKANTLHPKVRVALASAAAIAILAVAIFTLAPMEQKGNTSSTQEEQKIAPPEASGTTKAPDTTLENTEITKQEITQVDTQTLAKVEPVPILELAPDEEAIEDYEMNTNEMDTVEESLAFDLEEDIADKANRYNINEKPATPATTPSTVGKAITKDADLIVRSDELLGKKPYPVYAAELNPRDRTINMEEVIVQSNDKLSRKEKKAENKKEQEVEDNSSTIRSIVIRDIVAEYWLSIVNYKGYQYDGTHVKLYGIDQLVSLQFVELDNRLYMKINGEQYFLEKNAQYNRLTQVTNPTLLKVLNE